MVLRLLVVALLAGAAWGDITAPEYTIDLDLPAEQRWVQAMTTQMRLHGGYNHTFGPIIAFAESILPHEKWIQFDQELQLVAGPIVGEEFTSELRGIHSVATRLGHNVSLSQLQFFQIFYEIIMQCTGVLLRDPSDGAIVHGYTELHRKYNYTTLYQ